MPSKKKTEEAPQTEELLEGAQEAPAEDAEAAAPDTIPPRERAPRASDWDLIAEELAKPFDASHIRVKPGKVAGNGQALALWYIDARAVMDRLDAVVGSENWEFTWSPIHAEGRVVVQGMLTVKGVTKSDVGEARGEDEPWKSGVSDAFKRTAVQFGIGRFLYRLPQFWWPYDTEHRRFDRQDELFEFVNKVMHDLAEADGDTTRINVREYANRAQRRQRNDQPRAEQQGQQTQQGDGVGSITGKGDVTPAQDAFIRRLYGQKFGRYSNGNVLFANFLRRTIGRTCTVEKLTRQEADTVIKAMQEIGANANAA